MGGLLSKKDKYIDKSTSQSKKTTDKEIEYIDIPSNYFPKNGYSVHRLEPIARVLLMGVYDDNNPLSIFRGMRYLIKQIWQFTLQFNRHHFSAYIDIGDEIYFKRDANFHSLRYSNAGKSVAFKQIDRVQLCHFPGYYGKGSPAVIYDTLKFPGPLKEEININMMPMQMDYDKLYDQLPVNLHGYIEWIRGCLQADPSQVGKICYITIHESFVEKGKSQRRPGLHIEYPGKKSRNKIGGGTAQWDWHWGGGYYQKDGIFMASNINNSCAVWNCIISDKDNAIGKMGSLEHLKSSLLNEHKYLLEEHKLYWITDRTPHEALPMNEDGYRQFFRFVSSKLSVWYEDHSTKNPIGIVPNPKITRIVKGNKFVAK